MEQTLPTRKVGRASLRQQNTHFLLHLIQARGQISQADLARQTGLSPASVSGILQPLFNRHLLVKHGKNHKQKAGRKASLLTFNDKQAVAAGIVIDQEEYKIALTGLSADVLGYAQYPSPEPGNPSQFVEEIAVNLHHLLTEQGIPLETLVGVGAAMPGLIDAETGIVKVAANLGWRDVDLKKLLQSRLPNLPIHVDHLGLAKVMAETLWGRGVGYENVALIEIGSGIGAGIIMGRHLLRGGSGSAPEVGHMSLDLNGPQCACGLHGCWEAFCATSAIRCRMRDHLAEISDGETVLTAVSTLQELGAAAENGDALARQVLDETAVYMARGLVNVIWSFDPDLIILSGSVARDCPYLIEATRLTIQQVNIVRNIDIPIIESAQGQHAGVIAASALASVRFLERLANRREVYIGVN